jgi:alkanesulfonate monooxygenase SsuD/methylene tetrahydromethanopterin reductase-like flavin-dependent oxidoreductase (luciferase family)
VKLGLTLPQGCDREYLGVEPATAWRRTVEIARWAERQGFESLWVYDHSVVEDGLAEGML